MLPPNLSRYLLVSFCYNFFFISILIVFLYNLQNARAFAECSLDGQHQGQVREPLFAGGVAQDDQRHIDPHVIQDRPSGTDQGHSRLLVGRSALDQPHHLVR